MDIICKNCNSQYKIDEQKLGDKVKARIKCKKCGEFIDVENPKFKEIPKNPPPMKKNDDLFEERLPDQNEFGFEDVKETLVLNTDKIPPKKESKANMQIKFEETTSSFDINKLKQMAAEANKATKMSEIQTSSVTQPLTNSFNNNSNKGLDLNSKSNLSMNNPSKIDKRTENKFNKIEKQYETQYKEGGSIVLKIIFVLMLLITLFFVFIVYKNNWELKLNDIPGMISTALNGGAKTETAKLVQKEVPLSEQFSIDKTKIMNTIVKLDKKKSVLEIQGQVKNITDTPKKLITVKAMVYNMENKLLFSKRVYAGNIFSEADVKKAKDEVTFDALYSQTGVNGMNWDVLPNTEIPFMFAFYTEEVIDLKNTRIQITVESAQ